MGLGLVACDQYMTLPGADSVDVDFKMHKLDPLKHGFETEMGDLFNKVDPRISTLQMGHERRRRRCNRRLRQ